MNYGGGGDDNDDDIISSSPPVNDFFLIIPHKPVWQCIMACPEHVWCQGKNGSLKVLAYILYGMLFYLLQLTLLLYCNIFNFNLHRLHSYPVALAETQKPFNTS